MNIMLVVWLANDQLEAARKKLQARKANAS